MNPEHIKTGVCTIVVSEKSKARPFSEWVAHEKTYKGTIVAKCDNGLVFAAFEPVYFTRVYYYGQILKYAPHNYTFEEYARRLEEAER